MTKAKPKAKPARVIYADGTVEPFTAEPVPIETDNMAVPVSLDRRDYPGIELTPQELVVIRSFLESGSVWRVTQVTGLSDWRVRAVLRRPNVASAMTLERRRASAYAGMAAQRVLQNMMEDDEMPAAIRLNAAKLLVEQAEKVLESFRSESTFAEDVEQERQLREEVRELLGKLGGGISGLLTSRDPAPAQGEAPVPGEHSGADQALGSGT